MSYSRMYTQMLSEVMRLKNERQLRRAEIEAEVQATAWVTKNGEKIANLGAGIDHIINGRLATDPIMKDLQVLIDRAIAEATMYGVGAIIKNLAFLAKKVEK